MPEIKQQSGSLDFNDLLPKSGEMDFNDLIPSERMKGPLSRVPGVRYTLSTRYDPNFMMIENLKKRPPEQQILAVPMPSGIPSLASLRDIDTMRRFASMRPEEKKARWDEMVDVHASALAMVASGFVGKYGEVIESQLEPRAYHRFGHLMSQAQRKQIKRRTNEIKEKSRFLWEVSQNPDLAPTNRDITQKLLNLGPAVIPYISATTVASIIGGPLGGFAVGWMVEGNAAYQTAIDNSVAEEDARLIGFSVGVISGAIEVVGGRFADDLINRATTKMTNRIVQKTVAFTAQSFSEAIEEASQEVAALTGEATYKDIDWDEVVNRTITSAGQGASVGGLFNTVRSSAREMMHVPSEARPFATTKQQEQDWLLAQQLQKRQEENDHLQRQAAQRYFEAEQAEKEATKEKTEEEVKAFEKEVQQELFRPEPTEGPEQAAEKANIEMLERLDTTIDKALINIQESTSRKGVVRDTVYEILGIPSYKGFDPLHRIGSARFDETIRDINSEESIKKLSSQIFKQQAYAEGLDPEGILGPMSGLTAEGKQERIDIARGKAEEILTKVEAVLTEGPIARPEPTKRPEQVIETKPAPTEEALAAEVEGKEISERTGPYKYYKNKEEAIRIAQEVADKTQQSWYVHESGHGDDLTYTLLDFKRSGFATRVDPVKPKGKEPALEKPAPTEKQPSEPSAPGVSLLGGVPEKPPGLTAAEVSLLNPEAKKLMREAQAKGHKIGYKMGVAATARQSRMTIDAIRLKGKMDQASRIDAMNIVLTYAPKEKQGAYIRRILAATTPKRIENISQAINTYVQKAEKRQAKNAFKQYISKIRKTYRKGEVPLGQLPLATRERIHKVLDEYDTAKLTEKKTQELESRDEFVKRISDELSDGFEAMNPEYDEDAKDLLVMGNARIEELKRLGKTFIGDLDADQITYIRKSLEHLIKMNELKADSRQSRRAENLRTHLNMARQEVLPAQERVRYYTGIPGALGWMAKEGQASLETLTKLSTGRQAESMETLLVDNLDTTNEDRKAKYKEFVERFRQEATSRGVAWDDVKALQDRIQVTIGGKTVNISKAEALSIYAHTQATGNLERLLKTEGLNFTTFYRDKNGVLAQKEVYMVGTPTLAELRAINESISEKHKAFVEAHFATNQKVQAPSINIMSVDMLNYELTDPSQKYFHLSRVFEPKAGTQAEVTLSIDMAGRYQPRTGGNRRIAIRPFDMEVLRGMQQDATYSTMSIAMQEAATLIVNPKWRQAMRQAGQEKALNEMTTMMRRIRGLTADQSVLESQASQWLAGAAKSLLSVRPSGGLVQIASVPAAFEAIEPKYFVNIKPPTRQEIGHLKDISPSLWLRWEGRQFDYATGLVGNQSAFESLVFGKTPITSKLLAPYTWGDEIAINKIWHAAQNKVEAETTLKRGTSEFEQEALTHLHAALKTQPQWDMLHRSSLTSHPNPFVRGFTMFMSARNAQYNVLLRAVDDYRKERITEQEFERRIGGIALANVSVSASRRLFKIAVGTGALGLATLAGVGPSEPDEEAKRFVKDQLAKMPKESAFNLIGLNAFGGILTSIGYAAIDRIEHGSWEKADLSEIRSGNMIGDLMLDATEMGIDLSILVHQVMNNDPKWKETAKDAGDLFAQLIAYRYGLPWEGPKSDLIWPVKSAVRDTTEFGKRKRRQKQRSKETFEERQKRIKEP